MSLALAGWLPCWDVERRRAALDEVIAWTLGTMRAWGVGVARLDEIDVPGIEAMKLARALTKEATAPELRGPLHAALREMLPELPWEDVLVQTFPHYRILSPGEPVGPVPPHVDAGFGHGLDERNLWLALTDASGDAALHTCALHESLAHLTATGVVDGVLAPPAALRPIAVRAGDALLFTPLHVHAARPPAGRARVSIDLRIIPVGGVEPGASFSPVRSS
jgi:hypothetical protein